VILSVHLPKTAGTSFKTALSDAYGDRVLMDYGNDKPLSWLPSHRLRRWKTRLSTWSQREDLSRDFDVIHGHFSPTKYCFIPNKRIAAIFRNPVDQALSLYEFIRRDRNPDTESYDAVCVRGVTFEEFLRLPNYRAINRRYLAGKDPRSFAFVGFTEHYEESVELFQRIFGVKLAIHHERKNEDQRYEAILHEVGGRKAVENLLAEEMRYFRLAQDCFDALRRNYC
jgi:hypothetical protein